MKAAVIGLGSMGYGIAASLLRAGHATSGFDVRPEPVQRFRAEGGAAGALAEAAPTLDAVVVVVLNAAQTEAVLFGRRPRRASGRAPSSSPAPRSLPTSPATMAARCGRGRRPLPRRADLGRRREGGERASSR